MSEIRHTISARVKSDTKNEGKPPMPDSDTGKPVSGNGKTPEGGEGFNPIDALGDYVASEDGEWVRDTSEDILNPSGNLGPSSATYPAERPEVGNWSGGIFTDSDREKWLDKGSKGPGWPFPNAERVAAFVFLRNPDDPEAGWLYVNRYFSTEDDTGMARNGNPYPMNGRLKRRIQASLYDLYSHYMPEYQGKGYPGDYIDSGNDEGKPSGNQWPPRKGPGSNSVGKIPGQNTKAPKTPGQFPGGNGNGGNGNGGSGSESGGNGGNGESGGKSSGNAGKALLGVALAVVSIGLSMVL